MTTISDCSNRRAHRHTLPELRRLDAYADTIPRNLITKWIDLHEQPDARKQYRAAAKNTAAVGDLFAFVRSYRPIPVPVPRAASFRATAARLEPMYEVYEARTAAANLALQADELEVTQQLGITLDALRYQHWHATSGAHTQAEKRQTLARLRAGLLTGGSLELAIRRWGTTAWEDLATFREPDAPEHTRPRNRNGAPYYRRFPRSGEENETLTIGWPLTPYTPDRPGSPATTTR
ncbi:hypothetical protein [Curtobacterium flaccumfaciens]|uniref:hypothetical protein n=1 Tax=Curtobacterium flaccumfaciens TaxID=2035 RepID=UPI00188B5853|nr:hypothetical protein [Curtobacterium flaccumfaciens]MBF4628328.1 hypothetical protein [Curtobacterium flaccumfaciens]